jgi:hypothetical protein
MEVIFEVENAMNADSEREKHKFMLFTTLYRAVTW